MKYSLAVTCTISFLFFFPSLLQLLFQCLPGDQPSLPALPLPALSPAAPSAPSSLLVRQESSVKESSVSTVQELTGSQSPLLTFLTSDQCQWPVQCSRTAAGLADCCQCSRIGLLLSVQQDWLVAVSATGLADCCQCSRIGLLLSVQQDWLVAVSAAGLADCYQCSRTG